MTVTAEVKILNGLLCLIQVQSITKGIERVLAKISHQIRGMAEVNFHSRWKQPSNDTWMYIGRQSRNLGGKWQRSGSCGKMFVADGHICSIKASQRHYLEIEG